MAKIVAIANQKGGVGKTTTAVNLSSCVAALGKKTLIVDLDPQGNTTTGYGIPKRSVDVGTYELLIGEAEAKDAIRKTEFRTDVIGSNTRLAGAGLEMIDLPGRESRLRKALASVQKDYDFIFVDCPPSLDLLTLNGLCACDSVLIPIQCEYYALEGLSDNHVVIGYDSFDSSDNKLILNLCFQLFQMSFQIRRGGDENQCIRFLHDIVDVRTESDTLRVEFHPCQIGGIMSKSLKISDAVISSHVPINRVFLSQTHLCDGCSPTSSAHYRYLTG